MSQNWSGRARVRRPRGFSRLFSWGSFSCCCEFLLAVWAQGWAERHDGIGFQRCHRTGQDEREHGGREDFQGCFHGVPFLVVMSFLLARAQRWAERHDWIGFQRCHRTGQDEREHGGREDFQGCFHGVPFLVIVSFYWPSGHRGGQNGMMGSAFSDVTELVRTSASTAAARIFKVVFMGFLFLLL